MPGMFVRAEVSEGTLNKALLVPQQAVSRDPRGRPFVMVVGDNNKVEQRMIETERAIGSDWLVSSGLQQGEKVVVAGLQNIQPGAEVRIDDSSSEQQ